MTARAFSADGLLSRLARGADPMAALSAHFPTGLLRRVLRRAGGEPVRLLGRGLFGAAYLLSSGRVMKLTDSTELRAALALRRVRSPNVVRVHDAFGAEAGGRATAVVVRDAVDQTLDRAPRWMDPLVDRLFVRTERGILSYARTDRERRRLRLTRRETSMIVLLRFCAHAVCSTFGSARLSRVRDGIVEGICALSDAGIYDDTVLNTGNIGLSGTRPVIFDVTTPGRGGPVDAPVVSVP